MSDLIKGFIYAKDPLTLFAFLGLIFLAAFRTKSVPELFFRLAGKMEKGQFYALLKRFMLYGFVGFVLVCLLATVGQVLAFASRGRPYSAEDAQKEIALSDASEESSSKLPSKPIPMDWTR